MSNEHTERSAVREAQPFRVFLRRVWERGFSLDLRALAAFRIGVGFLLLWNLGARSLWLRAHYTDAGILPRSFLIEHDPNKWATSLFFANGSAGFAAFLFVFHTIAAVALLLGYRTRVATFLNWLLLLSLHNRNPWICQGGDFILHLLLFWGFFLPLGARASLDALRGGLARERHVCNVASAALILQIVFIYVFTGLMKTGDFWRNDGTAIEYALRYEHFTGPLGKWLLNYPDLLKPLTHSVLWMEIFGPVLLFMPFAFVPLRIVGILLFLGFHLGLALTMELGLFPYICAVAWLALLPSTVWEGLGRCSARSRLYGVCVELLRAANTPQRPREPSSSKRRSAPLACALTPRWVNPVAGVFLLFIFLLNVRSLPEFRHSGLAAMLQPFEFVAKGLRVSQDWIMFAPNPQVEAGWFVMRGELGDGSEVDLYRAIVLDRDVGIDWSEPVLVSAMYPTQRWRKCLLQMYRYDHRRAVLPYLASWLRREWYRRQWARHGFDDEASWRLRSMDIHYMLRLTRLGAEPYRKPLLLYRWEKEGEECWYGRAHTDPLWLEAISHVGAQDTAAVSEPQTGE